MTKRETYFDFLRGVAILMVVGIHTFPRSAFDSIGGNVEIVIRQMINCAVPLFLAISGFFLGRKRFDTKIERVTFWKKQIPAIYIPCFVWSLPLFLFAVVNQEHSFVANVARLILCGFSIYYFVILIIQLYIFLPYFKRGNISYMLITSLVISLISAVLTTYLLAIKNYPIPLTVYAGPFPLLCFYFVLGMYLGGKSRNYSLVWPVFFCVIGLLFEYLETKFLISFHGVGYGNKISFLPYSIVLLFSKRLEIWYERKSKYLQIFQKIGEISYGIYLIHCYVIIFVSNVIPVELSWGVKWLFVIVLTSVWILIVKKIMPSMSVKYLGFR